MPRRSARPKALTEDLAQAIYARLHAGQSVRAVCEDPAMPSRSNLYRWRAADLAFDQNLQALLDGQVRPERRHPRKGLVSYRPQLAQAVIARLAAGESQRSIARDPAMPCVMTLLKWAREVPAFAAARP